MRNPFRKGYTLSLHRVRDTVRIKEGNESLTLTVDGEPDRIVAGLNQAQKILQTLKQDTPDADVGKAAEYFASVMFGDEQAKRLMEFYHGDGWLVINVCGKYFRDRLSGLLNKAQKKG